MVTHVSKTFATLTLLVAVGWSFLSLGGCGLPTPRPNSNANSSTTGTEAENVVEPASPITTMEDMIPDLIDGTADSLTFKAGSASSVIQPGTLIASTSPAAPFLRRVVDRVVSESGEITLITQDVPLDKAFTMVDAVVSGVFLPFQPADGVTVVEQSQSSRIIPGVGGQRGKVIPVLDVDLSFKTNDNNAEASVGIKLKSSAILELKASLLSGLRKIKISMPSDYEIELGLAYKAADSSYDFYEVELPLGKVTAIFWVGIVPVYTEITLVASLSADFTGALTVTTKGRVEVGGQWTSDEGWSEILDYQPTRQQAKAKGQVSAQLTVRGKWIMYRTLGPSVGFGPYVQATLNALDPCEIELAGGLKVDAAIEFGKKLLHKELRDQKAFTFERKYEEKLGTLELCDSGPEAPTNLQAGANDGKAPVSLSWSDNSTDEQNFLIERKTDGDWISMTLVPADTTVYADGAPRSGKDNSYRVFAVGPSGERSKPSKVATVSIEKQTPPEAPTDLSATAVDSGTVSVTWTRQSDNESHFPVERATDGGGFGPLATVAAGVTSYTDITVEAGRTYSYRVRASNQAGASGFSKEATVKVGLFDVPSGRPAAPSHLAAVLSGDTVALTWRDHSHNENSFIVERSVDGGGFAPVAAAGKDATSTSDTVPDASKTYLYRVFAVNDEGASDYAKVASTRENQGGSEEPNKDICQAFGWCCSNDNVCDSSWFACPEEDSDCALCGVRDGRCPEMCVDGDPDCPSRELICGVLETCCAGDGRCDTQCPLSDLDPDCTNAPLCQQTGLCCGGDEQCHTFCNEPDSDCDPGGIDPNDGSDNSNENANDNSNDNTNDNSGGATGECSSVSYFASIGTGANYLVETPIRVVASGVDERLCADYTSFDCDAVGLPDRTRPIQICETETVQVFDQEGTLVGSFTIPFSLIDGRGADLPWVLIIYTPGVPPVLSVSIYFSEVGDTVDLTVDVGGDAPCLPGDCPDPTGACCVEGVCTEETEANCGAAAGTYAGDDVACADANCRPPEDYVVWYTSNVCCWGAPLVYISTRSSFEAEESKSSYPGGGIDPSILVTKVELQGGFATSDDARAWLCPQIVSRFNHYWCGSGYVQMNGANWMIGGCDTSNLPVINEVPDTNLCE